MWVLLWASCVSAYFCKFNLPDGSEYDLSKLSRSIPDYEIQNYRNVYRFNICQDTMKLCNGKTSIASQWDYNGGCIEVVARQGPTPPLLERTEEGLRLTYFNGDRCDIYEPVAVFRLHCSPKDLETRIGYVEETGPGGEPGICTYSFDIYSQYACFGDEAISKSYWWVLYLFLSIVVGYFVIGWFYNKYKDNEAGNLEAIPHSDSIFEGFGKVFNKLRLSTR